MTQPLRLFVDAPLSEGASARLSEAQAHYLGTVMRRRIGDPVLAFNGVDGEWAGEVSNLTRSVATLRLSHQTREQNPEPGPWLVFALLKRDATDLVVRMATELGVAAILPAFTAHTNAARVNEGRLTAIATEAAEQSERLTVPLVNPPRPLAAILEAWPAERRLYAALERSNAPPLRPEVGRSGLLVGPEGGFLSGELDALSRSTIVVPVTLGPRILRAETACLAGLVLLQAAGPG